MKQKLIKYYIQLLYKNLDQHSEAFIQRLMMLRAGEMEMVEVIEKMVLDPIEKQQDYIWEKLLALIKKEQEHAKRQV